MIYTKSEFLTICYDCDILRESLKKTKLIYKFTRQITCSSNILCIYEYIRRHLMTRVWLASYTNSNKTNLFILFYFKCDGYLNILQVQFSYVIVSGRGGGGIQVSMTCAAQPRMPRSIDSPFRSAEWQIANQVDGVYTCGFMCVSWANTEVKYTYKTRTIFRLHLYAIFFFFT